MWGEFGQKEGRVRLERREREIGGSQGSNVAEGIEVPKNPWAGGGKGGIVTPY